MAQCMPRNAAVLLALVVVMAQLCVFVRASSVPGAPRARSTAPSLMPTTRLRDTVHLREEYLSIEDDSNSETSIYEQAIQMRSHPSVVSKHALDSMPVRGRRSKLSRTVDSY